jgi:integrase
MVQELKTYKATAAKERRESAIWHDTGYVFTSNVGTPLDPRNVAKRFLSACRKAKIGKWHPHELRHTAASLMLANGVPLQVVSDILGHASIRITSDVYGHVLAPQRQEAAETMASFFAAWEPVSSSAIEDRRDLRTVFYVSHVRRLIPAASVTLW